VSDDDGRDRCDGHALVPTREPGARGNKTCHLQPLTSACDDDAVGTNCGRTPMSDACGCEAPAPDQGHGPPPSLWRVRDLQWAGLSGLLLVAAIVTARAGAELAGTALAVLGLVAGGITFVPGAVRSARRGQLGIAGLMTIAAVGAVLLGEVEEAAALAFLFSIAEGLEGWSMARTRYGLRALLSLVPERAVVLRNGTPVEVEPAELRLGEVMLVRPGDRVATDGTVRDGRSALDVSAITGESVPVEVGPGTTVFAGSVNGGGALEVEVTARTADNTLARVVRAVEQAQERKGAAQRLADRIARPLVPGVLVLSIAIAVLGSLLGDPQVWIERALVVLVAASPCALAISVPVTTVAAVGAASRVGVLVKGGAAMEALGAVDVVALDKTGTLTRNRPAVVAVLPQDAAAEVLRLAAALELRSEHPLARAITAACSDAPAAQDVQAVVGSGLTGTVEGRRVRLGRPGFVDAGAYADRVADLQAAGATVVLVEVDGRTAGAVAVRDELRPEAVETVGLLARRARVVMLTGDNTVTGGAIAAEAGISEVLADLRPEDKAREIARLQGSGRVAMVGDGVNDAPALATAEVGIAMGAMGSDVAIETADVALMGEDLRHLPQALEHARRARRIMLQNLLLSGAIVVGLVPLAAFGVLGLAVVVAIHEVAEVVVIANGVRAGRVGARLRAIAPVPDDARPAPEVALAGRG
jgi:cation-transporting ATPase G